MAEFGAGHGHRLLGTNGSTATDMAKSQLGTG